MKSVPHEVMSNHSDAGTISLAPNNDAAKLTLYWAGWKHLAFDIGTPNSTQYELHKVTSEIEEYQLMIGD